MNVEPQRVSASPPQSPEPVLTSEPRPETNNKEAVSEAEPITQQPQSTKKDGEGPESDKGSEKVTTTQCIWYVTFTPINFKEIFYISPFFFFCGVRSR